MFEKNRPAGEMTIDDQMRRTVDKLISEYGRHYRISLRELYELLGEQFGTKSGSIIPSDYCYNRANKGIDFDKKPRLFEFLGDGMYECLGEGYPYDKPVYTQPKGAINDIEVGVWIKGHLRKNENWDVYGLK